MKIRTAFPAPPFVMFPRDLAQTPGGLSADALGVLLFLASFPDGFTVHRAQILSRFEFSRHKWGRIRRELEATGCLRSVATRTPGGKLAGRHLEITFPESASKTRGSGNRALGAKEPQNLTGPGQVSGPLSIEENIKRAGSAESADNRPPAEVAKALGLPYLGDDGKWRRD